MSRFVRIFAGWVRYRTNRFAVDIDGSAFFAKYTSRSFSAGEGPKRPTDTV